MSIEVVSDKCQVYRIFKRDIIQLFGGAHGKTVELLKAIDMTQQINANIKIEFLEKAVKNNDLKMATKIEYIESSSSNQQLKPKHLDESTIKNILKEALKNAEASKASNKLNDLKASLIPNKAKALNTLKTMDTGISKSTIGGLGGTSIVKDDKLNKLNSLRPGMTSSQLGAKSRLEGMLGIKKNDQNQDEVNAAFQRINERKKGEINSKLLGGMEYAKEKVTFRALEKKLTIKNEDNEITENKLLSQQEKEPPHETNNEINNEYKQDIEQNKNFIKAFEKTEAHQIKINTLNLEVTKILNENNKSENKDVVDDDVILKTMVKKKSSKIFKNNFEKKNSLKKFI